MREQHSPAQLPRYIDWLIVPRLSSRRPCRGRFMHYEWCSAALPYPTQRRIEFRRLSSGNAVVLHHLPVIDVRAERILVQPQLRRFALIVVDRHDVKPARTLFHVPLTQKSLRRPHH